MLSRTIAALVYAGAAFLLGLALGERGELGAVQHVFSIVIPAATLVLVFLAKSGRVEVLLTGAAMLVALLIGQREFARAFASCPPFAESVKETIIRHYSKHGEFPTRLQDLGMTLPCGCALRKTILHYNSGDRGFALWITNDRETLHFGWRRPTAI